MPRQSQPKWAELPQELILLIIQKLFEEVGKDFRAVSALRSACKAWHAACSQFPASLRCYCLQDLSRLYAAFPQVALLRIRVPECSVEDLRPLSLCTRLTSLSLYKASTGPWGDISPRQIDLYHLPCGLKELTLISVLPLSSSSGKLQDVTQLLCYLVRGNEDASSALPQDLPSLRVISFPPFSCCFMVPIVQLQESAWWITIINDIHLSCKHTADSRLLCSISLGREKIGLKCLHLRTYRVGENAYLRHGSTRLQRRRNASISLQHNWRRIEGVGRRSLPTNLHWGVKCNSALLCICFTLHVGRSRMEAIISQKAMVSDMRFVIRLPYTARRLSGLTYLKLHSATVREDSALLPNESTWNLRDLEICNTDCSNTAWMNSLLQKLVHLTYLWLEHSDFQG